MEAIEYKFADERYLQTALTHSSYSNEYRSRGLSLPSNERLEFLGDAVLELVVSEYLYDNFSSLAEGRLTRMRQRLVCEKTLSEIAMKLSLGEYIHLGRGEENDCRTRPKVLADALEALIGAVFIDSRSRGEDESGRVVKLLFADHFAATPECDSTDYKTLLQQLVEKDGSALLIYEIVEESGPEHNKIFKIAAKVNNNVVGVGEGNNKKNAEMNAAKAALSLFGIKS
jgi:ribonuclease-3